MKVFVGLDQLQDTLPNCLPFKGIYSGWKFEDNSHSAPPWRRWSIITEGGFVYAWWCGDEACELEAKERMAATIRNIPLDQEAAKEKAPQEAKCVHCGKTAKEVAIFARAY